MLNTPKGIRYMTLSPSNSMLDLIAVHAKIKVCTDVQVNKFQNFQELSSQFTIVKHSTGQYSAMVTLINTIKFCNSIGSCIGSYCATHWIFFLEPWVFFFGSCFSHFCHSIIATFFPHSSLEVWQVYHLVNLAS